LEATHQSRMSTVMIIIIVPVDRFLKRSRDFRLRTDSEAPAAANVTVSCMHGRTAMSVAVI